nr:hypothetical protein JVH1_8371 [Rhodococcus sp. JVH1]
MKVVVAPKMYSDELRERATRMVSEVHTCSTGAIVECATSLQCFLLLGPVGVQGRVWPAAR